MFSGCSDEDEIKQAFEKSKDASGEFSVNGAIDQVLGSAARSSVVTPSSTALAQNTSPQKAKVVDLTDDNKSEDDLQKAIALSLVLNYTPPRQDVTSEKRRKILEFMSELRKLFSLLLNSQRKYVDPSRAVGILRGSLGGGGESSQSCSNQQDVSEFTHKLLDWLEEAFNIRAVNDKSKYCDIVKNENNDESEPMDSESEKMDKEKETTHEDKMPTSSSTSHEVDVNQMYSLFYGKVEIEGRNQGIEFSRKEQFGQWPLQVNGFKHIHDSLEASTAFQAIDSGVGGAAPSGQERWFTLLPPVLFLELSRFQFNTSKGVAEKINNTLEFPQEIFLDRYLEINKTVVRKKREEVKRLMQKRESQKAAGLLSEVRVRGGRV